MSNIQYEEEVKPTPVLIDVEAGNRTNKINDVFHLPDSVFKKWQDLKQPLHEDLVKTMLGEEDGGVGFRVGQQHIVDFLQKHGSQQMILILASNFLYMRAEQNATMIRKKRGGNRPKMGMIGNRNGGSFEDFMNKLKKDPGLDED